MDRVKHYSQINMMVPPSQENDLVRLKDVYEIVAELRADPASLILTTPLAGTYNSTAKTLTQTTPAILEVDGVAVALGDRILISGQLDTTQNGIYTVTTVGSATVAAVLTRAADFDESAHFKQGMIVPITGGDTNAGTRWKMSLAAIPFVLDTVGVTFEKDIVDFARVVELTFEIIGHDTQMVYDITHNLGTENLLHAFRDNQGFEVKTGFKSTSPNAVRVTNGIPLGAGNDLILTIHAQVEPV